MLKKLIITIFALLGFIPFTASCSSDDGAEPVSASGSWTEPRFNADINDAGIKMWFVTDSERYLYWVGTFPEETLKEGEAVLSKADLEVMENTITGTEDETATFTYDDGTLNFEFIFMGKSSTIHLEKQ